MTGFCIRSSTPRALASSNFLTSSRAHSSPVGGDTNLSLVPSCSGSHTFSKCNFQSETKIGPDLRLWWYLLVDRHLYFPQLGRILFPSPSILRLPRTERAPQKLSFCFKCADTGTVRILGNIAVLLQVMFTERLKTNGTAIKLTRETTNNQENWRDCDIFFFCVLYDIFHKTWRKWTLKLFELKKKRNVNLLWSIYSYSP